MNVGGTQRPGHRVAIIQSSYLPWKGYFDIIHDVDTFVFYDDVQYSKNTWRNRNKIKSANGLLWLTVPVRAALDRRICEVEIAGDGWGPKHWKTISQNYSKAAYFDRYKGFFEDCFLERRWHSLHELNQYLTIGIARELLGIRTRFKDSRIYSAQGAKTERLLSVLTQEGASAYLSGPAAKDYLEEQRFAEAGIALSYKSYEGYPQYPQAHPPFEHGVSIVDLIFHTGPDAPYYIWGWRDSDGP